jgi:hypothetical protein
MITDKYAVFVPIAVADRFPPLNEFVPVIDEAGEIFIYRRTEEGWNMRDSQGTNTPNTNKAIIYWLDKQYTI